MSSMFNKRALMLIFSLFVISLALISCQKEEKEPSKSMEQIREEEGIPIRVETVATKTFEKTLSFFSKLSGIQESQKTSMVADKVQSVLAKVGQQVKEGQVIIEFPTDNPALQYDQAKAALDNSETLYKRMKNLLAAGETSQQNYDNAETQYLVNKRNFESINQMLFVRAPISGKIIEMNVKAGDNMDHGNPLFTVGTISRMKARLNVSDQEVIQLKLGMTAVINFNTRQFTGKITEIPLAMNEMTRSFPVEVQFDNRGEELKSGILAEVKINTYVKENSIVLPRSVILTHGDKKYVYIESNGIAVERQITTGEESGIEVEVLNGLKVGDRLITEGIAMLENGKKVVVK
jgi:membrane fusion protein, multidrug efflux system